MKNSRWIIVLSLVFVAWQVIAAEPADKDTISIYVPPKPKPKTTTAPATKPMMRVNLSLPREDQMGLQTVLIVAYVAGNKTKNRTPSVEIRADAETPCIDLKPVLAAVAEAAFAVVALGEDALGEDALAEAEFADCRLIAGDRQVTITIPELESMSTGVSPFSILEPIQIALWPKDKTHKAEVFQVVGLGITTDAKIFSKVMVALSKSAGKKHRPAVFVWAHPQVSWKNVVEACACASDAGFKKIYLGVHSKATLPVGLGKEAELSPTALKKKTPLKPAANRIVYVVNRSGSMLDTFDMVRHELVRSIDWMNKHYDFHLIFLGKKAPIENTPRKLVPANMKHKRQAVQFMRKIEPEGMVDPLLGLKRAFDVIDEAKKTKPGKAMIVLITDGDFFNDNEKVLKLIAARNKDKSVIINTFLFGGRPDPDAEKFFKKIAADNGGKFKMVQRDW